MQITFSKEQFLQFQAAFKARANAKQISSSDILLYNIVRGKDARRGFTELTNQTKINNGGKYWDGWKQARYFLQWRFKGPKSKETIKELYSVDLTEEQLTSFFDFIKDLK